MKRTDARLYVVFDDRGSTPRVKNDIFHKSSNNIDRSKRDTTGYKGRLPSNKIRDLDQNQKIFRMIMVSKLEYL